MFLSLQCVIDTCFRKIFNVKSEEVVQECETEFGVFQSVTLLTVGNSLSLTIGFW